MKESEEPTKQSSLLDQFFPPWLRAVLGGVVSLIVIIGILLGIYYNFTPQMSWIAQPIPSGPNSCTSAVYNNACPASLTNGTAAAFYLKDTGGVPATLSLKLSSKSVNLTYHPPWNTNSNQTVLFAFIPHFSHVLGFSIQANASCSGEILGICRNSFQPITCNYTITNNSNVATLIPS